MDERIKVISVENDIEFASLIGKRIMQDTRLFYMGYAADKESGIEMARSIKPHIVVMDLSLSANDFEGNEGVEAAKAIRVSTDAKIIFLTAHDEPETIIAASKKAFASGYVFKNQHQTITDDIYNAATANTSQKEFIKELVLNELTPAERWVLDSFMRERVFGKAARSTRPFGSSTKTIANQRGSILKKLNLKNADELFHVFRNW
jgi:DNA-binding NarL/FixJ family response regulator